MSRWGALGAKRDYKAGPPNVGDVVAWDRCAYLVTHVADAELLDSERGGSLHRPPYMMTIQRIHGPANEHENDMQERALRIPLGTYHCWEVYDEGRVPLCSCCGHPWPCMITDAKYVAERQAEAFNAKLDRAAPGQCYSCGEVITYRQGSVTYPEPNVELLGYPAPRFHTRKTCAEGMYHYDQKRAKALPDAPPINDRAPSGSLWGNDHA
ncbi:MAG: hypothetical protein M3536_00310 [Actinomycetota bacterium]|nr:hypothetical protein [Actinomycetota bacterium]